MQSTKFLVVLPLLMLAASCNRDPHAQAQRYLDNGNKFFEKGKFQQASIMYYKALQKDRRFGEVYYRIGLNDLKLGQYSDAGRQFRRAVELQPNNIDAEIKLCELYLLGSAQDPAHSAELTKVVEEMTGRLLQRDPKSYDGHRLRGEMLILARNAPEAVAEFEKANQAKPYQPDLVLSYFQALVADNQFPAAEKLALGLIGQQKTYSPIYDLLYLQYRRQERVADAERLLKLKVENNPKQANFLLQLAAHFFVTRQRPEMDAVIQRMTNENDFPEGHLLAGDFFFLRLKEFEHAQEQYEAAVKAFPKDKVLYQKRLVELFAATGKNPQANDLLAAILKQDAKDQEAIAMRAALMLTTGNREQINAAANDLQALVAKTPQNHVYRFNLARAMLAKGDLEGAALQLEEAAKIRPDFVAAKEMLGRINLVKGDSARALKSADEILKLDPNNLAAHLMRSTALLSIGDTDKARQELDYIVKAYPQSSEAQVQVGYLAWKDKDYRKAEKVFGDLHKSSPNDVRGLVGVTETMFSQGHPADAIKTMQDASAAEPQRGDLKLYLANFFVRAERYDEAVQLFQGLIEKDPRSADLLSRLAETQRIKGELNQAIDSFRRCAQVAAGNTKCLVQLGLLMDGTGKREQAKPIYEQILKIQPDQPVALNNLAYIKAEEGTDLDQALTMAQRARQKAPNSPDIADTLGWIYIKKNLSEDAVRVFRELVQKDPANPTFHYHYGMALMQKGDKASAKKELEAALKAKPSKDEQNKIQELLQKI